MKKSIFYIPMSAIVVLMMAACSKENNASVEVGQHSEVTASANLVSPNTKLTYTENGTYVRNGLSAVWSWDDSFYSLESSPREQCEFNITAGVETSDKALFTTPYAETPTDATQWLSVLGRGERAFTGMSGGDPGYIWLGYHGQDGTLASVGNYSYVVAKGTGKTPSFDFANGIPLTLILRCVLYSGVAAVEFNSTGWCLSSTKIELSAPLAWKAKDSNIIFLTLKTPTTETDNIRYIAIPATDYSKYGLIMTFYNNADKSKANWSYGLVVSTDCSSKAGQVSTLDTRTNMTGLYRPTEGVKMGDYGTWAPCNLGADPSITLSQGNWNGGYFAFGEVCANKKINSGGYHWTTYMVNQDIKCGIAGDPIYDAGFLAKGQDISDTRFDAARVKWGVGWRMPTFTEFQNLAINATKTYYMTNSSGDYYTNGGAITIPLYDLDNNKTQKGFRGVLLTIGSNSIFLPRSLYYTDDNGGCTTLTHNGLLSNNGYSPYGVANNQDNYNMASSIVYARESTRIILSDIKGIITDPNKTLGPRYEGCPIRPIKE